MKQLLLTIPIKIDENSDGNPNDALNALFNHLFNHLASELSENGIEITDSPTLYTETYEATMYKDGMTDADWYYLLKDVGLISSEYNETEKPIRQVLSEEDREQFDRKRITMEILTAYTAD